MIPKKREINKISCAIGLAFYLDSISGMCKQRGQNQTGHSSSNESSRLRLMEIVWQSIREEGARNQRSLGSPLKSLPNTKKYMHRVKLHKSEQNEQRTGN